MARVTRELDGSARQACARGLSVSLLGIQPRRVEVARPSAPFRLRYSNGRVVTQVNHRGMFSAPERVQPPDEARDLTTARRRHSRRRERSGRRCFMRPVRFGE